MNDRFFTSILEELFESSPIRMLQAEDKLVIFSDMHLGGGSEADDFLRNADICSRVLREHYLKNGFTLVLNGDIEDLQKYSRKKIIGRWGEMYELFHAFDAQTALFRVVGNHDIHLLSGRDYAAAPKPLRGLRLDFMGNSIFIFHGHQASLFHEKFNYIDGFFLRYFAQPFGIMNYSVSHDSVKRFKVERRVYDFSAARKILSIIGHTHRPLFESLSKIDSIKFRIEQLCRSYIDAQNGVKERIARDIRFYRQELQAVYDKDMKNGSRSSLYNSNLLVPCLFNSGCTVGKRGITAIEIENSTIRLVYWFDREREKKHFSHTGLSIEQLENSNYYRMVLKSDCLNYIFTRINLLT
jgi:UDP-2,3-diacylglucosamine pyrophosphatase LpxH